MYIQILFCHVFGMSKKMLIEIEKYLVDMNDILFSSDFYIVL